AALGRVGQERRGFDLQALRAGGSAREDEQIPRLVPRAAPATAGLAVSACSRLFPRKTTVGALKPATELRRIVPRVGAVARSKTPARWPVSRCTRLPERKSHRRDLHDNSCSHEESMNSFARFGNRPTESDH